MVRVRDGQDDITRGFARLAAAEACLSAMALSGQDAIRLSSLRSDIAAGLVLLSSQRDGTIGRRELGTAAALLALVLPAEVMARLPAAARLAVLDLVALAQSVAAELAAVQRVDVPKNEKPRRRQDRPRLELVVP